MYVWKASGKRKTYDGSFLQKPESYMVNFSSYIEQSSVKLAQDRVGNVVNPSLAGDENGSST